MQRPIKYAEKGLAVTANGLWHVFNTAELDPPQPLLHAEVVGEAAQQVVAEDEAAAGLAASDRLALPDLHA